MGTRVTLELFKKFLNSSSRNQVIELFDKVDSLNIKSEPLESYFASLEHIHPTIFESCDNINCHDIDYNVIIDENWYKQFSNEEQLIFQSNVDFQAFNTSEDSYDELSAFSLYQEAA